MNKILRALALVLSTGAVSVHSAAAEQWQTCLASCDAGPASSRVDLALRKRTPLADYPYLVMVGPTYVSERKRGLPEIADIDRLEPTGTPNTGSFETAAARRFA